MPWQEVDTMSLRREFVQLASQSPRSVRELCRRFSISPKTGYKWLSRFQENGENGLSDRSRRPLSSPFATPTEVVAAVLDLRDKHPAWGGRKLYTRLVDLGMRAIPSPSTITGILRRSGRLSPPEAIKQHPWKRFSATLPNELWQMDFKGHMPLLQGRCHPLTVLDDHSRFSLGLRACRNEQGTTVQAALADIFRTYGLPSCFLFDNGGPWGSGGNSRYTALTVWLIRLGIRTSNSRPRHPQTLGKDERFHRTLKLEVFHPGIIRNLIECQKRFDVWRDVYNFERPHEALAMKVPGSCYRSSPRPFPESLPAIEYPPGDEVRRVQQGGWISFRGGEYPLPKALESQPVALRPQPNRDQWWDVFFCHQKVAQIDLNEHWVYT